MDTMHFGDANSRHTYFTVHNVREAHRVTKGKGVRVGVIDSMFAMDHHGALYSSGVDVVEAPDALHEYDGHGLWMASALKEIAPECEVVAVNGVAFEGDLGPEERERRRCLYLAASIDWAIEAGLDVLTYSQARVPASSEGIVSKAISDAVARGITTTFIHCAHPDNIWPYGCLQYYPNSLDHRGFTREPDLNIYHNDYNTLMVDRFKRFSAMLARGEDIRTGDHLPFFSFSSMSPVLAGFVALLKSLRPELAPAQCKDALTKTCYAITEQGEHWYDLNPCQRVVDIGKAVNGLL